MKGRDWGIVLGVAAILLLVGVGGFAGTGGADDTTLNNSTRVDWRNTLSAESYQVRPNFDDQGRLYIAANGTEPRIQRLDYRNGDVIWEFTPNVSALVVHGPAIANGEDTLYVTTSTFEKVPGEAYLFAVYDNGTERWRVNLTAQHGAVNAWRGPQTDAEGNVYFVVGRASTDFSEPTERYLVSYAPDGTLRWNTTLFTGRRNPRFVDFAHGNVVISGQNALLVNKTTGAVEKETSTPYGTLASPPRDRDDDQVFYEVDSENNDLYAVYTTNLTTKWTRNVSQYTNGPAYSVPTTGNGDNVYWFANPGVASDTDSSSSDLLVIDEDDGSVKRTVNLTMSAPTKTRPFVRRDGRVYTLTVNNKVISTDPTSEVFAVDANEVTGDFQAGWTPTVYGPHGRVYFGFTEDFDTKSELVSLKADPILVSERVAYQGKNTQDLRSMNATGDVIAYDTGSDSIKQFGPVIAFLDGDSVIEIPYVNNTGALKLVDRKGERQRIDRDVATNRLGIGDLDEDGSEAVVYVRSVNGQGDIFKTEGTNATAVGTTQLADGGADVQAVAGVTDFNNDGTLDVVFLNGSSGVEFTQNGNVTAVGAFADSTQAISVPADFDNDGDVEVALQNKRSGQNNNFLLVDENGPDGTYTPLNNVDVAAEAMGALDVSGDGVPDIVFQDSNRILYYSVTEGTQGEINASEEAKKKSGVT